MRNVAKLSLACLVGILFHSSIQACSCFGPQTFCGTLDPPYAQPEWWIPDAVVLGVKLSSTAHGMDVLVLNSFSGELHPGDTVAVWGDTGNLCRWYTDAWSIGDTVVWSIMHTDQAGGVLEQPEDYHISACGIYWLEYQGGTVSGPITTEGGTDNLSLQDFEMLVTGCLTTGVEDHDQADPITVRQDLDGTTIHLNTNEKLQINVFDGLGQICMERTWNGTPIKLQGLPTGMYTVAVLSNKKRWVRKVLVE